LVRLTRHFSIWRVFLLSCLETDHDRLHAAVQRICWEATDTRALPPAGASACTPCSPGSFSTSTGPAPRPDRRLARASRLASPLCEAREGGLASPTQRLGPGPARTICARVAETVRIRYAGSRMTGERETVRIRHALYPSTYPQPTPSHRSTTYSIPHRPPREGACRVSAARRVGRGAGAPGAPGARGTKNKRPVGRARGAGRQK
jgi:hypothetical protein